MKETSQQLLNKLLLKLMPLWLGGRCIVNLYTPLTTVSLSDFSTQRELTEFVLRANPDMIYIKTNYGEWQIYLKGLQSFKLVNNKDNSKILKIFFNNNSEIVVNI
jgi:hypothetical protein